MNLPKVRLSSLNLFTIGFMLAISVLNFVAFHAMETATYNIVKKSVPMAETTQRLLQDLVNQETGVRGFIISGEAKFLEPYKDGQAAMQVDLATLQQDAEQNSALADMLDRQVVPQIEKIESYFNQQINLVEDGKAQEASARVDGGKANMDAFREMNDALLKLSHEETESAWSTTQAAGNRSQWIIIGAGLIALLIAVVSSALFARARRAELALKFSEERYRSTSESLEAQNEEIVTQQEELETTLRQLTEREKELEWITSFQEKLTGYAGLSSFLDAAIPALLDALDWDAALLVLREEGEEAEYRIQHAFGYPRQAFPRIRQELYGSALRVFDGREPLHIKRTLSGDERGLHEAFSIAYDTYYPLLDDNQTAVGFVLLTGYTDVEPTAQKLRLMRGLMRQFSLALLAQLVYEERRRQADRLSELNAELSAEKDVIRRILESSHEGMVMTDPKGIVRVTNPRVLDYLGAEEAIGKPIVELFEKLVSDSASLMTGIPQLIHYLEGQSEHLGLRFERLSAEGEMRHLELYATRVGDSGAGVQDGYLFVIRDRTEEERIDELKNEFVSIVSHELRTPLASILGFIEILLNREVAEEKRRRYLTTIFNESKRLSNLINDFLDLQRMESGKQVYHIIPLSPAALLKEVTDQWNIDQTHHAIRLHAEDSAPWLVRADQERLRQVLHNLISNAVKYSPGEDHVDVYLRTEKGRVYIDIRDYGLGIPDDARDKLFTKFFRVDNSDRRLIGGTGLGLSICKEIIDAQNGEITFQSKMGQGSTFTVSLERHLLQPMAGKIVIAEDDEGLAGLIEAALQKSKLATVRYRSTEEGLLALQMLGDEPPLLCIVDLHLEGVQSGWAFVTELNRHPRCTHTPVIISSISEQPKDYRETGSEVYLRKPFTIERLQQVVHQLLQELEPSTLVFLAQDEAAVSAELQERGLAIDRIHPGEDFVRVRIKPNPE